MHHPIDHGSLPEAAWASPELPWKERHPFLPSFACAQGTVTIRFCDDIVDRFSGLDAVVTAFQAELGIRMGETSADGAFSLEFTPCIGMCDQAPAAMINDVVATKLTVERATAIARALKGGMTPVEALVPDHDVPSPCHRVRARGRKQHPPCRTRCCSGPCPRDAGLRAAAAHAHFGDH